MNLHEAAAVYLIIGSVLLGPIIARMATFPAENQRQYQECMSANHAGWTEKSWAEADEKCKKHLVGAVVRRETTAETCARAMREVGATKWPPTNDSDFGGTLRPSPAGWYLGKTASPEQHLGLQVFCIPAPTGLVR